MDDRRTTRQRIASRLGDQAAAFEELRSQFALTVRDLEEHLRHIERSTRGIGLRLRVEPARCIGCGFVFSKRALHPPGRCPQCRDRRVEGPWFRIC